MKQDGAALIRAMISKEGSFFWKQLVRVIADVLYKWSLEALGQSTIKSKHSSQMIFVTWPDHNELGSSSRLSNIRDFQSILSDRRLKVIFFKILNSARKDPVLMLRFCWASVVMFISASALACHRVLVSLSEAYIGPISFAPKQFAIST